MYFVLCIVNNIIVLHDSYVLCAHKLKMLNCIIIRSGLVFSRAERYLSLAETVSARHKRQQ